MQTARPKHLALLLCSFVLPVLVSGCSIFQNFGFIAPSTPTNLAVGDATDTALKISWNASTGATSYQLSRSTSQNGPWTQVYNSSTTSYTDSALTSLTTYWYEVAATNAAGSSAPSAAVSGTTTGPNAVVTPTFSPAAGTYATPQGVTISTTTTGASIRYTTDGTDPSSTAGTLYSTPVSVAVTTTIKAIAYMTGMADSAVASAAYTITGDPLIGTWTFVSGSNIPTGFNEIIIVQQDQTWTAAVYYSTESSYAEQLLFGAWKNSSGNYSIIGYSSGPGNTQETTGSGVLSGSILTLTATGLMGVGVYTFQRGTAPTAAMASDPILGTWTGSGGGTSVSINAQSDGSFALGMYNGSNCGVAVGTWASSGTGSYAIRSYNNQSWPTTFGFGTTLNATLSGSSFTIPGGQTNGPTTDAVFTQTGFPSTTANPISGIWQLTLWNGRAPSDAQMDMLFVGRNDGSVFGAMVNTNASNGGTSLFFGSWTQVTSTYNLTLYADGNPNLITTSGAYITGSGTGAILHFIGTTPFEVTKQ
ncbi:MAG: chitobiase/beta-hexosaminidase C-terminal domain-containing protein [Spirochaetia bacterium]|jgi:hypothetical protein